MKVGLVFSEEDLHYTSPITVGKKRLIHNRWLRVVIKGIDKEISHLEFSSLPHFHHYSLKEWRYALSNFFSDRELQFSDIKFERPFFNMAQSPLHYEGELLFIIESVLFSLIENLHPELIPFKKGAVVKVNALYSKDSELEEMPECVKIKIRPTLESLSETIEAIKKLRAKKKDILFRLDGNQCFTFFELDHFLRALEKSQQTSIDEWIQYIEEPFANFADTFVYSKKYAVPLAFDESLAVFFDKLTLLPKNSFIVIKPSLFGLSKSLQMMTEMKGRAVISSSYESARALRGLLFLSSLGPEMSHGLDTQKYLPKDLSLKMTNFLLNF
ncbi:MAG: hypothetical protein ACXVLQ_07005 [Bacteriovorax sp.]